MRRERKVERVLAAIDGLRSVESITRAVAHDFRSMLHAQPY